MRAHDFLLEYDRARTMDSIPAIQLIMRMTPFDFRDVANHWEGHYDITGEQLEEYCKLALGIITKPRHQAHEYKGYLKFTLDFIMDMAEQADPTPKKKFTPQILRWWYKGRGMGYLEDMQKAHHFLGIYMKFKNRITGLNLKEIDFHDFSDQMEAVAHIPSGSEEDKAEQQRFFDRGEAELVVDNKQIRVVIPKTEEAAKYFGKNTRWCTSAIHGNRFKHYNDQGPLYIILFKSLNERWQWHFQSGQFMDARDVPNESTNVRYIAPKFPELVKIWDAGWRDKMSYYPGAVLKMFEPTVEDFRRVIFRDGDEPWDREELEGMRRRARNILTRSSWNTVQAKDRPEIVAMAREVLDR